jgi:hypothetical protein
MVLKPFALAFAVLLLTSCASVPLAEKNRAHINKVRLGQTLVEVARVMGPPERRAARLRFDGVSIEEWSYVTDSIRKLDSLIVFVGGKVEEIQSMPWDERD